MGPREAPNMQWHTFFNSSSSLFNPHTLVLKGFKRMMYCSFEYLPSSPQPSFTKCENVMCIMHDLYPIIINFNLKMLKRCFNSNFADISSIKETIIVFSNLLHKMKTKNYETYYRSARLKNFEAFFSISNNFLLQLWLFWSIFVYLTLSQSISDYLGSFWSYSVSDMQKFFASVNAAWNFQ